MPGIDGIIRGIVLVYNPQRGTGVIVSERGQRVFFRLVNLRAIKIEGGKLSFSFRKDPPSGFGEDTRVVYKVIPPEKGRKPEAKPWALEEEYLAVKMSLDGNSSD